MAILVMTQYLENYGAHESEPANYWKFKGGAMYKILGTDERPANAVALVAETLHRGRMGLIQQGFTVEVPTSHVRIDDDATPDNEWETYTVLQYERLR